MRDLSLAIPVDGLARKKSKSSASVYRMNLAIIASIALLSLTYLFMINSLGTKGYEIRKLEEMARNLEDQQKNLQMQSADLQSINRIQTQAQKLNFVPTSNVSYLKASDFALK